MVRVDVIGEKCITLTAPLGVMMTNNSSSSEIVLYGYIDDKSGGINKWI